MRLTKIMFMFGLALLVGGGALTESALGRGGGGRGGRGGKGKGKRGADGQPMDRPQAIEASEAEMHTADRDRRFQSGRRSTFDEVQRAKRNEVLDRHRRMGEDSRRQQDSRGEVTR